MVHNAKLYPLTAEAEMTLMEAGYDAGIDHVGTPAQAIQIMLETLGEYEHGSVDVEDLFPELAELLGNDDDDETFQMRRVLLQAAAAVITDMCLTIQSQI